MGLKESPNWLLRKQAGGEKGSTRQQPIEDLKPQEEMGNRPSVSERRERAEEKEGVRSVGVLMLFGCFPSSLLPLFFFFFFFFFSSPLFFSFLFFSFCFSCHLCSVNNNCSSDFLAHTTLYSPRCFSITTTDNIRQTQRLGGERTGCENEE